MSRLVPPCTFSCDAQILCHHYLHQETRSLVMNWIPSSSPRHGFFNNLAIICAYSHQHHSTIICQGEPACASTLHPAHQGLTIKCIHALAHAGTSALHPVHRSLTVNCIHTHAHAGTSASSATRSRFKSKSSNQQQAYVTDRSGDIIVSSQGLTKTSVHALAHAGCSLRMSSASLSRPTCSTAGERMSRPWAR